MCAAFDRDDALYLRDEAEKARHRELELRDAEMGKFTRIRHQEDGRGGPADADSSARKRPAPSRCAWRHEPAPRHACGCA